MELLPILWMFIYMSFYILCFSFMWSFHYVMSRSHFPPGISQPGKLRFATVLMDFGRRLGLFLEIVGICHRYKLWRFFFKGIPPRKSSVLIVKDLFFDGVAVRVYWPRMLPAGNTRGMLVIPGGFGMSGTIQAYERMCRYIARESHTVVVNVGFRLAPEHPYPTQIQDCCTATVHFLKNAEEYQVDPSRVTIGGESSGGSFATAVCQILATRKDLPKLRAQALIYPFLQAVDFNLPSYQQNHSVPFLFKKFSVRSGSIFLTGKKINTDEMIKGAHVPKDLWMKYKKWIDAHHIPDEFKVRGYLPMEPAPFSKELYELLKKCLEPTCSPLLAEDDIICQLPETFLVTSEYDTLRDDGLLYKKRLEDNGVPVTWHHIKGGVHGMTSTIDFGVFEFSSARSSLQHLVSFLEGL